MDIGFLIFILALMLLALGTAISSVILEIKRRRDPRVQEQLRQMHTEHLQYMREHAPWAVKNKGGDMGLLVVFAASAVLLAILACLALQQHFIPSNDNFRRGALGTFELVVLLYAMNLAMSLASDFGRFAGLMLAPSWREKARAYWGMKVPNKKSLVILTIVTVACALGILVLRPGDLIEGMRLMFYQF